MVRPLPAFITLRGAPSLLAETLSAFISLCRMLTALAVEGCKLHFSNLHKAEQEKVQVELQVPMLGILYLTPSIAWHPESLCMSAGLLQVSTCGNIEFKDFVVVLH